MGTVGVWLEAWVREWWGLECLLHIGWALFFGIRGDRSGGLGGGSGLAGGAGIAGRCWVDGSYLGFRVRLDNFFFSRGLQRLQVFQAAGILALDTTLIAGQPVEDRLFAAIEMIGKGQRVGAAILVELLGHRVVAQAQVEVSDFDAGDAAEAVRGDGHAFDQVFLDLSAGVQVGAVALGEVQEVGGVFARQDGGFAGESVDGAVAAGARFAFGAARAGGFFGFLRLEFVCDSVDIWFLDSRLRGGRKGISG